RGAPAARAEPHPDYRRALRRRRLEARAASSSLQRCSHERRHTLAVGAALDGGHRDLHHLPHVTWRRSAALAHGPLHDLAQLLIGELSGEIAADQLRL